MQWGDAARALGGVSVHGVSTPPLVPQSHLDAGPNAERRFRLLETVRRRARERRLSARTEKAYVYWTRRYVLYHGRRHPRDLGWKLESSCLVYPARATIDCCGRRPGCLRVALLHSRWMGRDFTVRCAESFVHCGGTRVGYPLPADVELRSDIWLDDQPDQQMDVRRRWAAEDEGCRQ